MQKHKKAAILLGIIIIIATAIIFFVAYQYLLNKNQPQQTACTLEAKICPDGSSVGRTGPNCEFAECQNITTYTNNEYGFSMAFPNSWKGYIIEKSAWNGQSIDGTSASYTGVKLTFKNPQSTAEQSWQDIPIMIFTPDVWKLVAEEKVAVSAAPIGPEKIGENEKYIFATPPRWYGFTDDVGIQEALDIVKTFKAF